MGRESLGLVGRFALFHIYSGKSVDYFLCKVLDAQSGYVLLHKWSLFKDEPCLGLPALYPIDLISAGDAPWRQNMFGDEYTEEHGANHFAQLFPDWKSAAAEYEIEQRQRKEKNK